jgi:hypothetical protein
LDATYSDTSNPAVKGEGSAKIVVSSGGIIAFPTTSAGFNFYTAANTPVTADITTAGTYNWNTAAGGAGKAGWLKQQ